MREQDQGAIVDSEDTAEVETQPTNEDVGDEGIKKSIDELYEAAFGDGKVEPASGTEAEDTETAEHPAKEEPTDSGSNPDKLVVRYDQDLTFVDEDGTEHKLKASDILWRTNNYHRKLQEVDTELKTFRALDEQFKTDPVGLVQSILDAKEPKLAEAFRYVLEHAKKNGVYDPQHVEQTKLQYEREKLEKERSEINRQREMSVIRQQVAEDVSSLQQELGRNLTQDEIRAISSVLSKWEMKRAVDPDEPLPNLREVYNLATAMLEYDNLKKRKPKAPPTSPERPTVQKGGNKKPTLDELYDNMVKSLRP